MSISRLKRGVWVEGRVMDAATASRSRPSILYYPPRDNPHVKDYPDALFLDDRLPHGSLFPTDRDGRFRAAVLPGRGLLTVQAREPGYLTAGRSTRKRPASSFTSTSTSYLNVSSTPSCRSTARGQGPGRPRHRPGRGRTQHIRITDADGRPVPGHASAAVQLEWTDVPMRPLRATS